jgi:hypothetical protein
MYVYLCRLWNAFCGMRRREVHPRINAVNAALVLSFRLYSLLLLCYPTYLHAIQISYLATPPKNHSWRSSQTYVYTS